MAMKRQVIPFALLVAMSGTAFAQEAAGPPARQALPAGSPSEWILPSDYPPQALLDESSGTTKVGLQISPDGFPTKCAVVQSSGVDALDRVACDRIMQRARFYPARNEKGELVVGQYTTNIQWEIPERQPVMPESDFEATFVLDETGEMRDCEVIRAVNVPPDMLNGACPDGYDFQPLLDDNGNPVAKRIRAVFRITHEDIVP